MSETLQRLAGLTLLTFTAFALYEGIPGLLAVVIAGRPAESPYVAWLLIIGAYAAGWTAANCARRVEAMAGETYLWNSEPNARLVAIPLVLSLVALAVNADSLSFHSIKDALPYAGLTGGIGFLCVLWPLTQARALSAVWPRFKPDSFQRFYIEVKLPDGVWKRRDSEGFFATEHEARQAAQSSPTTPFQIIVERGFASRIDA